MTPEALWRWAQLKGVKVIGTGDFSHPEWIRELKEKLEPAGNGLFALRKRFHSDKIPDSCRAEVFFLLSAEISCIYSKGGKTRKIHSLLLVPEFRDVERIHAELAKRGNLKFDGRPTLGLDAKELLKIALASSPDGMLIPAHAWTPHFSLFGAASGFDTMEECFEELSPHVRAIETGLSSDPPMNWRLSALDSITLLSNSDAHSPARIGREANIFSTDVSYRAIAEAIKTRKGFSGTIEFFPEEGKYHHDGHRACGVSLTPEETIKHNCLCPVCGRKVTVGVMHRVEELADRNVGFKPEGAPDFHPVIPLQEIIAETLKVGVNSKAVEREYLSTLEKIGSELRILMESPEGEIGKASSPEIAHAIAKMRSGEVSISPGFDGEYGKVRISGEAKKRDVKGQVTLS